MDDRRNYNTLIAVIEERLNHIKETNDYAHNEIKDKIDSMVNLQGDIKELRQSINWLTWGFRLLAGGVAAVIIKLFGKHSG